MRSRSAAATRRSTFDRPCTIGAPLQVGQRREINLWRTSNHGGAEIGSTIQPGIETTMPDGAFHFEKLAYRALLYSPHADLPAEIGMPTIMNLQFFADMGRMNG